jgi:DNA-binding transcriptional LysR family regulator
VEHAFRVLRPTEILVLKDVNRTFALRTSDGFVENFGPTLLSLLATEAPGISLHFVQKVSRDSTALRDGTVDLETGVVGRMLGPEVRTQALFRDQFVGVVRKGHPLCRGELSLARYAAASQILVSRGEAEKGPVDLALAARGIERKVATAVTGFAAALTLTRATDLVATVPARHTTNLRTDLHTFALPFRTRELTISLLWHPRMDADPAHRWLRDQLRQVCAEAK